MTAVEALRRAIYYLDRELAPPQKVRAFQRAIKVVESLAPDELRDRVQAGTLTDIDGIGKSTGSVISAAVMDSPPEYLDKLDARSRVRVGQGAAIRKLLKGDCHMHSTWSDGGATIEHMASAARALGHEYVVMTDHSPRLTIAHGLSEERLVRQLDEIAQLNDRLAPFRVLTGMEVDILVDGTLDLSDTMLERLDVVVASVHSKLRLDAADMTRRIVRAVASPHVDILGHVTNRKVLGSSERPPSQFDADMVFAACARFDTAVEINCRPERQDPPDELLALALDWDVLVAINTDAHAPGQLEWQHFGCDKAARHNIESTRIVNTLGADELVDWADSHSAG